MIRQQVDAVAALIFNVGDLSNVAPSAWAALLAGNFDRYLIETSEIRASNGIILPGLEDRRADEVELFTQYDYTRSFDHLNGVAGSAGNPYAPGNYGGTRDQPSGIPEEWVVGDLNRECFPKGTTVNLWGDRKSKIESIVIGDLVLTYDATGNPVPGIVDKIFTSTTQSFITLTFADDRDALTVTPGHRFLTETGDYMEIGHMLRLGGGRARLVDLDGSIVEAVGETIAYSAETAHLFERAQTKTIASQGNTALKEQVEEGWKTYNFEVRTHHNYVAGGIRVHNDSILSTLQAGDTLLALSSDLSDAAIERDGDLLILDGYKDAGGDTRVGIYYEVQDLNPFDGLSASDVAENLIAGTPSLANNPMALLTALANSGSALPVPTGVFTEFGLIAGLTLSDISLGTAANNSLTGNSSDNIIDGGGGSDTIHGGAGDDIIFGGAGNDFLTGEGGADTLDGGAGNDWINGGFGWDEMIGGTGADRFYHVGTETGFGTEWIHDFSDTEGDRLVLGSNGTAANFVVSFATSAGRGSDAVAEAFITYVPTGQVIWILQDGANLDSIMVHTDNGTFDLL